jgi:hypothetical protein
MTNQTMIGRAALQRWEASRPTNFFQADQNLQAVLARYVGNYDAQRLAQLGAHAAQELNTWARLEDRLGNHPKLERWNGIGERLEQIEFHPAHDQAGQLVWGSGIMALQGTAGRTVEQMALFYLLNHNGEAGHSCSLACTSGLIRALQHAADEPTRTKFLPPLLNPDYTAMQHGAQFLTEVQGGSDVGANAVSAVPFTDGTWRITGEKWFCSNVNADQFLLTARATAADGTRGLGLFLVPRRLDDGSTNGFYIRRLKDKLGTRTLASAELDFLDALAYPIGAIEKGFKTVVELVLNTSRLMNAVACAGIIRRAYVEASTYACQREAFGQVIAQYPLVQEATADLLSENYAAVASSFYLAHLVDKLDTGQASESEQATYRLLVNLNKYITSIRATEMVHRAIEVFGGNGAIESFSVLPRLYRDTIVLESWEGTHNVLCLQVLRDIARLGLHEGWSAEMHAQLQQVTLPELSNLREITAAALDHSLGRLQTLLQGGERYLQAHARRWSDQAAYVSQAILLLAEAQWEIAQGRKTAKSDVAQYFIQRHIQLGYEPLHDEDYLPLLERLLSVS